MKKFFFSALMLLCLGITANAQTKIVWDGYGSLGIKVKRCYVQGPNCIVDVLLTNKTGKDLTTVVAVGDGLFATDLCAYDDEGNTYDKYAITGTCGNSKFGGGTYNSCTTAIPSDTSVKLSFKIKGIDEFAASITTLMCNFRGVSDENYGMATLKLKDIPITRE